jgi:hypothetical protein
MKTIDTNKLEKIIGTYAEIAKQDTCTDEVPCELCQLNEIIRESHKLDYLACNIFDKSLKVHPLLCILDAIVLGFQLGIDYKESLELEELMKK